MKNYSQDSHCVVSGSNWGSSKYVKRVTAGASMVGLLTADSAKLSEIENCKGYIREVYLTFQ
jgi:hypothetical protein